MFALANVVKKRKMSVLFLLDSKTSRGNNELTTPCHHDHKEALLKLTEVTLSQILGAAVSLQEERKRPYRKAYQATSNIKHHRGVVFVVCL
jgi:hypothetical protein